MEANVKDTLKKRGSVYGDYTFGTRAYANIMGEFDKLYQQEHKEFMPGIFRVAISYIVMKLIRLAVTPDHIDSWHDIQGYAKLNEEMFIRLEETDVTQN